MCRKTDGIYRCVCIQYSNIKSQSTQSHKQTVSWSKTMYVSCLILDSNKRKFNPHDLCNWIRIVIYNHVENVVFVRHILSPQFFFCSTTITIITEQKKRKDIMLYNTTEICRFHANVCLKQQALHVLLLSAIHVSKVFL